MLWLRVSLSVLESSCQPGCSGWGLGWGLDIYFLVYQVISTPCFLRSSGLPGRPLYTHVHDMLMVSVNSQRMTQGRSRWTDSRYSDGSFGIVVFTACLRDGMPSLLPPAVGQTDKSVVEGEVRGCERPGGESHLEG